MFCAVSLAQVVIDAIDLVLVEDGVQVPDFSCCADSRVVPKRLLHDEPAPPVVLPAMPTAV